MTGIDPRVRQAILRDYRQTEPDGSYVYTVERVAGRNRVTTGVVNTIRVQEGLQRNAADAGPSLYGCPVCSYRALHPAGHAVCMGDTALAEVEASQALLIVSVGSMFQEEEVA